MDIFKLVKKDIIILTKKPQVPLYYLLFPIIFIIIMSFISSNLYKNLSIYIDSNLANEFSNKKSIKINYLGTNLEINLKYKKKEEILTLFKNKEINICLVLENNNKTFYLNKSDSKAPLIYSIITTYLNRTSNFKTKVSQNLSKNLALLAIFFITVFASTNIPQNSLSEDIEKRTIYMLKKVGFKSGEIILSKIVYSVFSNLILISLFTLALYKFNIFKIDLYFFLWTLFAIINSSIVGITISSISIEKEISGGVSTILFFSALYFPLIENSLNIKLKILFYLNPLLLSLKLSNNALTNAINLNLILISIPVILIFYFISIIMLNKQLTKSF